MSNLQSVIADSKSFEEHMLTRDKRSKKLAWSIAIISCLFAFLCITAVIVMLPLKQTEIELYTVDKQTGRMEYITRVKDLDLTTKEAQQYSTGAYYVQWREGYNYFSLQDDYNRVQEFNSPAVNREYLALYASKDAPDKVYENANYVVTTKIISNVVSPATAPDMLQQIRVKKTIRRVQDGSTRDEIWNIRITFHFVPWKKLTTSQREVNPLGYTVTSYQRDKELRNE